MCTEAGIRLNTDPRNINAAYAKAHRAVVIDGSPLAKAGLTQAYLKTEIQAVIKGRGVQSRDTYLELVRTGRKTPFTEPMRLQVWDLMETWDEEMARRGTVDFPDVMLRARDVARGRSTPMFRAAIVDEAQDITMVGLQLVRALVNGSGGDPSDGLLLVGDGAQRIYAGGFTLRQAGVQVTGRSTVLRTNYRNTAQILDAAMAVAGDQPIEDLGEEYQRGDEVATNAREGGVRPLLVQCAGTDDEAAYLVRRIRELVDDGSVGAGDIGVFLPTNREVDRVLRTLRDAGFAALGLEDYDGTPTASIKVGHLLPGEGFGVQGCVSPGPRRAIPPPAVVRARTSRSTKRSGRCRSVSSSSP